MTARGARLVHAASLLVTVLVAFVNAVLAATGVLAPAAAFTLWLAVEVPLAVILVVVTVARVRSARGRGLAWSGVLDEVAGSVVADLIRFELRGYLSLWLWLRRRYDGAGPGVTPIGYTKGTMAVPLAFLVAALVETVVVHLLVPWPIVRAVLLVVSLWGLVQIAGILAGRIVHPHLLTADRLVVRSGHLVVADLDRRVVSRGVARRRWEHTAPVAVGDALYLPGPDGTCLDVHLTGPVGVRPPRFFTHARATAPVSRLSLQVDDPEAVVAALASPATRFGPGGLTAGA